MWPCLLRVVVLWEVSSNYVSDASSGASSDENARVEAWSRRKERAGLRMDGGREERLSRNAGEDNWRYCRDSGLLRLQVIELFVLTCLPLHSCSHELAMLLKCTHCIV